MHAFCHCTGSPHSCRKGEGEGRQGGVLFHSPVTGNITTISIKCNHSLALLKVTGYLSYPRGAINREEERRRERGERKWQTGSGKENITGLVTRVLSFHHMEAALYIWWLFSFCYPPVWRCDTSSGASFIPHLQIYHFICQECAPSPLKTLQRRPSLTSRAHFDLIKKWF